MNNKIFSIVCNANKGAIAVVETLTNVNIPKKWGLAEVTKYTHKRVQVGYEYESAVNRRRLAEGVSGEFNALSLPWGEWLVPNRVLTHKGKTYYRLYDIEKGIIEQTYYVGGKVATSEEMSIINAYLASKSHTSRQGVVHEVKPTAVDEGNIISIVCGDKWHKDKEYLFRCNICYKGTCP